MIIYKVTNTITGLVYIGQTVQSLDKRWSNHGYRSQTGYLSRSIQKHGKENFTIEQIDSAETLEELNKKEVYWIQFYDATNREKGYNIEIGGGNHPKSKESIEKQRKAMTGKKLPPISEETRTKQKLAQLGRKRGPHTEETKAKMREKATNRKHTQESKDKMREYRTGKKNSLESTQKQLETKRKNRLLTKE